jgi:WD40 repeat protein
MNVMSCALVSLAVLSQQQHGQIELKLRQTLQMPAVPGALAISANNGLIAAGSSETIFVWDWRRGKVLAKLPNVLSRSLSFSADGGRLASGGWRGTRIWEVAGGRLLMSMNENVQVEPVKYVGRPEVLVFASDNKPGSLFIWDRDASARQIFTQGNSSFKSVAAVDNPSIEQIAASPQSNIIALLTYDAGVVLYDLAQEKETAFIPKSSGVIWRIALSADGKRLITLADQLDVWRIDPVFGTAIHEKRLLGVKGTHFAWLADRRYCITVIGNVIKWPSQLVLWDLERESELTRVQCHSKVTIAIAISEDGSILATAGGDAQVKIWEVTAVESSK